MSALERFFRKIQQNNNPTSAYSNVVAVDIERFCRQMDELAQQICQWLDGSGIKVITSTTYLNDLSTVGASLNSGASRYEITTIRIQNGNKGVDIIPELLYREGAKGCAKLTVNTPDNKPEQRHYYLHLNTDDGWLICDKIQSVVASIPLTEDVFFQIIERIA